MVVVICRSVLFFFSFPDMLVIFSLVFVTAVVVVVMMVPGVLPLRSVCRPFYGGDASRAGGGDVDEVGYVETRLLIIGEIVCHAYRIGGGGGVD